jgi:gliding motility-associated peptidyl-prolyl isomerase
MLRKILIIVLCSVAIASCKSPEARKPIKNATGTFIEESAVRNKKLYEQEKAVIQEIIDANPETTYLSSDSGFWYFYNQKDSIASDMPEFGDIITFTYDVKDLNGNTILSETEIGLQNYKVDQSNQDLTSGLRDGLKLMKVGETVTFLFPSYKAYGYYGIDNILGTNVPIQSKVTLKSIEQSQEN